MLALLGLSLLIIPLWRICARAGFQPAMSLVAAIPFVGLLVVAAILAFGNWPADSGRDLTPGERP
ncbi:MAG: hypothetical protein V4633_12440 [Pseudomonadota bacterium]